MLVSRQLTLTKSMFFGLTQTLPSFLASAWLALLEHPDNPARLDISRRPIGQLGLGKGLHACVGAVLVRTAFAAITPSF
jgi:cytochrome P450